MRPAVAAVIVWLAAMFGVGYYTGHETAHPQPKQQEAGLPLCC